LAVSLPSSFRILSEIIPKSFRKNSESNGSLLLKTVTSTPPFISLISGSGKPASLQALIIFSVPRPQVSIYPPKKQALAI